MLEVSHSFMYIPFGQSSLLVPFQRIYVRFELACVFTTFTLFAWFGCRGNKVVYICRCALRQLSYIIPGQWVLGILQSLVDVLAQVDLGTMWVYYHLK